MNYFNYNNGSLYVESVSLSSIARNVGTPFYVYSSETISKNFEKFERALSKIKHSIAYSVKANSNIAILRLLGKLGAGMDIVSSGEYLRAKRAGIDSNKIVFSGVGKTENEISIAIEGGVKQINVESEPELISINRIAGNMGKIVPVAIRVNPDIDAITHRKITTGRLDDKFGVPYEDVFKFSQKIAHCDNVRLVGLAVHIGSQLTNLTPFRSTFEKISVLVKKLKNEGYQLSTLDLGGGIGIPYSDDGSTIDLESYVDLICSLLGDLNCEFEFEPGRLIVGNAGALICSVIYLKQGPTRNFLIIDGAMNDLIRPAMYEAYHHILPVEQNGKSPLIRVDIVGPVCETSDTFCRDREFPLLTTGDLVAVLSSGAYGAVMASEYNSRPLVPEVLVNNSKFEIIRSRPSIESILERDKTPSWLN